MTPEPRLRIGPCGWDHPGWQGGFYPDDLPADWRVAFLGAAAQAVLVPARTWADAGPAGCAHWAAEVPDAFRFYLEVDQPDGLAAARSCAAAFGDRLGGLLLRRVPAGRAAAMLEAGAGGGAPVSLPAAAGPGPTWRLWADAETLPTAGRVGVLLLGTEGRDLRALRRSLEAFAQARDGDADLAVLVTDRHPSAARLRELRVLAELLGLA